MEPSSTRGNNPERWNKLLEALDEKLQLGLLDHLRKVKAYHFEDDILFLEASSADEEAYFAKDSVAQQLQLLAADAVKIEKVKLRRARE